MPCRAYTMEYQQAPKPVNACLLESSNAYNNQLAITTNNYSASFAAAAAAAADLDDNIVLGEIYDTGGVLLQDLSWRVEKLRLEEQNIQRFLKARPRFLPYNECRKWVQAFNRWQTEDDWNEWIAMGEKRNAYIPVCDYCSDSYY